MVTKNIGTIARDAIVAAWDESIHTLFLITNYFHYKLMRIKMPVIISRWHTYHFFFNLAHFDRVSLKIRISDTDSKIT